MEEMKDVRERLELVLWLVASGADLESEEDDAGLTPLLVAGKVGASSLAKLLVQLGATADVESHQVGTPDRPTDRQDRQTDRQTQTRQDRQLDRQLDRKIER